MPTTRRDFLDRLAAGAAALGGFPLVLGAARALDGADARPAPVARGPGEWDTTWPGRIRGAHRAVFDVPEVESGYGVWRASLWAAQYRTVLGAPASELSTVLILRHNAIVLAMQQDFWDTYGIGNAKQVRHPVTLQRTDRNPALLSSARDEVPAQFDPLALDRFLAAGGIALACDLALRDCVQLIQAREHLNAGAAHARAVALMVPGVILQPSGVFAAVRAQEAGCVYVRAS